MGLACIDGLPSRRIGLKPWRPSLEGNIHQAAAGPSLGQAPPNAVKCVFQPLVGLLQSTPTHCEQCRPLPATQAPPACLLGCCSSYQGIFEAPAAFVQEGITLVGEWTLFSEAMTLLQFVSLGTCMHPSFWAAELPMLIPFATPL